MSATTKSLRCLIVEDVEDDALLMLHQLRTGGYDPTWERVDTPEAMRAALERQPWDVVLSDYRMPRFSGLAALELLRASGLDLPFIIVSGAIGEEIAVAAMKAGVDDYLVKGRLAHLTVAVEREMRNAVMRRKHREAKAEVQKSEARLAIALEASQSGVWDLDLLDNTAYHTLTHDRIFGYEAMQPGWSRDKFLEHVLPEDCPMVARILHEAVASRSDLSIECRIRRADGVVRWILFKGAFKKDVVAKTERIVGIVRDITERKREEKALRKHAAELRARNETLTRFNGVAVGRELRMIELKREVNELCRKQGESPRHRVARTGTTPEAEPETQAGSTTSPNFSPRVGRPRLRPTNQLDRSDVRILVVDDDPEVLRVTARLLEKEGYAIKRAADGEEALRSVEADHPALLLLDRSLPGIDGLEVCRRIKENPALADIFVIIISGKKIESADQVEGLRTGADDYIARPVAKRELVARVEADIRIVLLNRSLRLQAVELKKNIEAALHANAASLNLTEDAVEAQSQLETAIQELRSEIVERERAEKSLRLNTIALTAAANAIVITDRSGAVVWANPSFTTMTGYTLAEAVGKNLRELVKSGQHERVFYKQMWETILAGGVWRGELVNRRKDGSLYPEEMTITPVRDSAEAITHFIAIKQDITVPKLADEAMRTNKARLSDAMKLAHLGAWDLDVASDRFTFDELFYIMLRTTADREGGYSMSSARYIERFVHPDDRALVAAGIRRPAEVPDTDYIREVRHRAIFGDGEIGYLAVRFRVMEDAQGRISKVYGVNQDITKEHASFARIREQAEIINQAPVSIIITDLVGRIIYCNPASARIYGFKRPEEMIGLLPEDIFDSAAAGAFAAALAATIRTGTWIGEVSFHARDGRQVRTSYHMSLILDEAGKPKARLSIAVDITEKRQFEEQALRTQRVENLGMLAAGIAHDFNNALAPIVMAGPLLRMQVKDPIGLRMLDIVDQSAVRGAALVRQMLSFARGTIGDKTLLQASHILHEVLDLAVSTFPKSILVESHLANDLWPVMSDPTQIQQILLNLCINARDAMPDGGTLTLTAANCTIDSTAAAKIPDGRAGRFIAVEVRDTGTGIQPDVLEKIWEPFFTTKSAGKGTGLGLSTVRSIIRQNDGFATVVTSTNARDGHGTVFTFYLPAAVDGIVGGDAGPKGNLPHSGRGELILLVDDEPSVCEMGARILTQHGYLAIAASNGLEAITAFGLHASKVRLLLTDLDMPSLGGRELSIALRRLRPDLPVIVMSGGITQTDQRYKEYATAYMPKPFTVESLLSVVRQTLDEVGAEVPPAASSMVEA